MRRVTGSIPVKKWTPQEDARLRFMYAQGMHTRDIAAALGCSRSAVDTRAGRIGVKRKEGPSFRATPGECIVETPKEESVIKKVKTFTSKIKTEAPVAADYLRKYYSSVFRCDIKMYENKPGTWGDRHGLDDHGKNQYFVAGKGTMWIDELVELAQRHGLSA